MDGTLTDQEAELQWESWYLVNWNHTIIDVLQVATLPEHGTIESNVHNCIQRSTSSAWQIYDQFEKFL